MKRISVIMILCVLLLAMVGTTAVSAAHDNTPAATSMRHYDIVYYSDPTDASGDVVGKLTIDVATGHWVVTTNVAKAGVKDDAKAATSILIYIYNAKASIPGLTIQYAWLNDGGNFNWQATDTIWAKWWNDGAADHAPTYVIVYGTEMT